MSTYPATADLPQTASVVARYLLDEASGNAIDEVGALDLTDTNTVTAGTGLALPGGTFDNARDFEAGNSEHFTHVDNAAFDLTGAFSFAVWVNLESLATTRMVMAKDGGAGNLSYFLTFSSANTIELRVSNDGTNAKTAAASGTFTTTGSFFHLGVVYQPSTRIEFYIDGASNATDTTSIPASIFNSTAGFKLGANGATAANFFDGLMQDAIIWKGVALSDAEVAELYELYQTSTNIVSGAPIFFT